MSAHPDVSFDALRSLARGLLYDRHGAEDVVQEAWLAALRAEPPAVRMGAWLTEAVKRIARNRRRDEARRRAREAQAARGGSVPGAGEVSANIEVLRALLDALEHLEEPYRAAVSLRYLEEQPPREIARRLGVPVNTARTHVRRGLERLRRDLDGERGEERQKCLAALAPLAGGMPWSVGLGLPVVPLKASIWSGALLMEKKLLVTLVAAVLIGVSFVLVRSLSDPSTITDSNAVVRDAALVLRNASHAAPLPAADPLLVPAAATSDQREPVASAAPTTRTWVVRGHAFRGRSEPFSGLTLVGRVYAGPSHTGVALREEHFHADESGDFAWALEPPTELVTVLVEPEAPDCLSGETYDLFLPGDPAPERWTVRASPLDCVVRGSVRDPEGNCIVGASVKERSSEGATDTSGRYVLRIASGRESHLRIRAPGFAQKRLIIDASRPGELQAPEATLTRELRLRGRVLGEDGRPLAGARVEAGYPFFGESATTDAEGAFVLGTLDLEVEHLSIAAQREGYVSVSQRIDPAQRTAPVELRLARGARVSGRVLDPLGNPVLGAWISVGYQPWMDPRIEAYSDREGRFVLEHVPSGAQTAWAWRTGFAQERVEFTIPDGASSFALELAFEAPHFVGGIVLDERGQPLPWAMVYAEDPDVGRGADKLEGFQSWSGPDGRFRIEGLPELAITLGVVAAGRARVEQEVTALDRDDFVLRMPRSAGFAGTVMDAASGNPISAFTVRLGFPPEAFRTQAVQGIPSSWMRGVAFTDPEGRWHFEDDFEPDQIASITVEAAGYAPATVDAVRAALAADPAALVVRLAAGTVVRGRVLEKASGAPIPGARIRRCTARVPFESLAYTDELVLEAQSDAAGRFELQNVPTGSMSLVVEHPDWTLASDGPFEVTGAATSERWIELGTGASVRGRLLDPDGASLGGETVSFACLEGVARNREQRATTDEHGNYVFANLSAGVYHLRWERIRDEIRLYDLLQRVAIEASEALEVDLQAKGRATLTGTLEYDGELPEVVRVMLMPRSKPAPEGAHPTWAESGRADFAENGRFTVTHLEPGAYSLSVHLAVGQDGFAMGSAQVDVPTEGGVDVRVRIERRR